MELPSGGSSKHTFDAVSISGTLPTLARSRKVQALVKKLTGARAKTALEMMKAGKLEGELGNELHDFLADEIHNEAETVWTGQLATGFAVFIQKYEGVYFVSSPDYDDVGYFLKKERARDYIYFNWMGEVEEGE
jgi:hypothetical protein